MKITWKRNFKSNTCISVDLVSRFKPGILDYSFEACVRTRCSMTIRLNNFGTLERLQDSWWSLWKWKGIVISIKLDVNFQGGKEKDLATKVFLSKNENNRYRHVPRPTFNRSFFYNRCGPNKRSKKTGRWPLPGVESKYQWTWVVNGEKCVSSWS